MYCDNADCNGFSMVNGPNSSAQSPSTGRIDPPWVTTEAWQGFIGNYEFIEFGKAPFAEHENGKTDVVAGDIGYYPGRQTLCLFYGETQPFGEVSYVARVRSNLEGLARCGRRLLETGHLPVRMERA